MQTVGLMASRFEALGNRPVAFAGLHYVQTESDGTWERPIANNCTTCALYNLLSYFDQDHRLSVERAMLAMLLELRDKRADIYGYISDLPDLRSGRERLQITQRGLRQFLELLDVAPELINGADPENFLVIRRALRRGKPLMILDSWTETLAGYFTPGGHAYLVYPGPQGECLVADSNRDYPFAIPVVQLQSKLYSDPGSRAFIIHRAPDIDGFSRRLARLRPYLA